MHDQLEAKELANLQPYACASSVSAGRRFPEMPDPFRTAFQKDRDRVLHCKAFRRLSGKTQVFVAHYGDHYRTRLSHSLEVAQISRGLARSLGLNEDLSEAIALAHDLGHTPFGHAGEDALNEVMKEFGSCFEHNEQSQRVVTVLERAYPERPGLNLSFEVLEGLMKHHTPWDNSKASDQRAVRPRLEAEIVNMADEIAYQNHDVDDGLRSNLISLEDLGKIEIWQEARSRMQKKHPTLSSSDEEIFVSRTISSMIFLMVENVVMTTAKNIENQGIKDRDDLLRCMRKIVTFSADMREKSDNLRELLKKKLYFNQDVLGEMNKGKKILKGIFLAYFKDINRLPPRREDGLTNLSDFEKAVAVKDYVAGMTDSFALDEAKEL